MSGNKNRIITLFFGLLSCMSHVQAQRVDLSGHWRFATDRHDEGVDKQWYSTTPADRIKIPGSMMTNNKGDEVTRDTRWIGDIVDRSYYDSAAYEKYRTPGNIKYPFWLQPNLYYAGRAWYQRDIVIPKEWEGRDILLFMERCHWNSELWIDGRRIGRRSDISAPQRYVFKAGPGHHRLTVSVDNRIKDFNPGINSHSISDNTQGNWNGIVGEVYMEALPLLNIADTRLFPHLADRKLQANLVIQNTRATEALLNYIEAEYMLTKDINAGKIMEYWKTVREKAGFEGTATDPNITIAATDMSKETRDWGAYTAGELLTDKVLYNIRRERRSELLAEGLRWMDLQRWRSLDQMIATPVHAEGIHLWNTVMEKWYTNLISDGTSKANVSSKDLSEYYRPHEVVMTNNNFKNGLTWHLAHYLDPLPLRQFLLTADDHATIANSPLYQNPYWPTTTDMPAEK